MTLRIAITRALPEALASAERVRARGHEPVLAPLLRIAPRAFDASLVGVQALLFSSSNGVRAFAQASAGRGALVLAVGDATAQAARDAGFADVRSADGDVAALADLARAALTPGAGKLVHISGAHAAGDLAGALQASGFSTERRIAYEAVAADTLPEAFSGELDVVLFHSARAAATFIALGAPKAASLRAVCLSQAVAEAAAPAPWACIVTAERPREDALLDAALG
jgi:uroporphyrinogen-III synthase